MTWTRNRPFALSLLSASVLTALTACGGDDSSTSAATQTTVSGTAEVPDSTSAANGWASPGETLLAWLTRSGHADVTGLTEAENAPVSLIRIDSEGNQVEELDSDTTDENGEFTLETSESIDDTSIVVEVDAGDGRLRGPAREQNANVDPFTEAVLDRVIDRVSSGDASLDQYSPDEVAASAADVEQEFDARDEDLSGSTDDAVQKISDDQVASERIDQNLDAAENDDGVDFAGAKNSVSLGARPRASADTAGIDILAGVQGVDVTDAGNIETAGNEQEARRISRTWSELGTDSPSPSLDSDRSEGTTPSDEPAIDTLLRTDGTFSAPDPDGTLQRGIRTGDGDVFALATGDKRLIVGAQEPSDSLADTNRTYNLVSLDFYTDEDSASAGQVGVDTSAGGTIGLRCNAGDCSIELTRAGASDFVRRGIQSGPQPQETVGSDVFNFTTTGSDLSSDLTLDGVSLADSGRLEDADDGEARGFVAPGGDMISFFFSSADPSPDSFSGGFPFARLFVGLPEPAEGSSCDAGTFSGTYNVVRLSSNYGAREFSQAVSAGSNTVIAYRSSTYEMVPDGQGNLSYQEERAVRSELSFPVDDAGNVSAMVADDAIEPSFPDTTYTVDADCTLDVEPLGDRFTGAVSPDGEVAVLVDSGSGNASGYQGLNIAIRQPQGGS